MHRLNLIVAAFIMLALTAGGLTAQTTTVRRQASLMDMPGGGEAVVLDVLSQGMSVEVLTIQGNWARVRIPATSEVGWVESAVLARGSSGTGDASDMPGGVGMSGREMERVEGRVETMIGDLEDIEVRIDSLLTRMSGEESAAAGEAAIEGEQALPGSGAIMRAAPYGVYTAPPDGDYRWRNQFLMGTYIRGGQDYYGLALTRALDSRGRNMLVGRAQYGLGEIRGKADDFIDWTVGMDFNLFPETYVIYPYFGAHFGMRHLLEDTLADRNFFIVAPTLGIRAELGNIFTLGAELRGLFRFESGHRRDDGMVGFTCGYNW